MVLALKGTSGNAELGEKSTGAASAQEATEDADVVLRQIGPGFLWWTGLFCLNMASWQDCQATPVLFPGPGRLGRAQGGFLLASQGGTEAQWLAVPRPDPFYPLVAHSPAQPPPQEGEGTSRSQSHSHWEG